MAENNNNQSFSVDDILKEVRAMREQQAASVKSSAVKSSATAVKERTAAVSDNQKNEHKDQPKNEPKPSAVFDDAKTQSNQRTKSAQQKDDISSRREIYYEANNKPIDDEPVDLKAKDKAERAAQRAIDKAERAAQKAEKKAAKEARKSERKHKSNIDENDNFDNSENEIVAQNKRTASKKNMPQPKVITPDEINKGFEATPIHVNQRHRPKVITANELRGEKPTEKSGDSLKISGNSAKDSIDMLYGKESSEEKTDRFVNSDNGGHIERKQTVNDENFGEIRNDEPKKSQPKPHIASSKEEPQTMKFADIPDIDSILGDLEAVAESEIQKEKAAQKDDVENEPLIAESAEKNDSTQDVLPAAEDNGSEKNDVLPESDADKFLSDVPKSDIDDDEDGEVTEDAPDENNSDNSLEKEYISDEELADEENGFSEKAEREHEMQAHGKRNFRIIRPKEVESSFFASTEQPTDDEIDDYRSIDDAESIRAELDSKISHLSSHSWATFLLAVLLGAITVLPGQGFAMPAFLSPEKSTVTYLTVNLVLFACVIMLNFRSLINGLISLIKLRPDIDTPSSIAVLAALAHSIMALQFPVSFANGKGCLYTAVAAASVFFNLRGKKVMFGRIRKNFDLVATTGVKQSCFALKNKQSSMLTDYKAAQGTTVACSRPVLNLHDFLYNSFSEDPSDRVTMITAPLMLLASLVVGGFSYFVTRDVMSAIGSIALLTAAAAPFTCILSANMPIKKACKSVAKYDGLLSGYSAVESFGDTEYAVVNDYELFPAGTMELLNLKAIGDNSLDEIMMDAAAISIAAGGPLADVFDRMIEGRADSLKKTRDIIYTDGKGLCGYAGDDKISVGNRAMIDEVGDINLPDIEVERRIARSGCFTVYIAKNDQLCGMLVVKYNEKDETFTEQLQRLTKSGVTLLVKTCDPNVSRDLICRVFSLERESVQIMTSDIAAECDELTMPRENDNSILAHQNSLCGYAAALTASKRLKLTVTLAVILQTVGLVLGFIYFAYLAITGGYASVMPFTLLGYQLICTVITLAVPAFRRA